MNKAIIRGFLGADPEVKTVSTGKTVCRMSVATSESWTDRDGQRQENTQWHRIVCWKELAVNCGRFLAKGSEVLLEGRIETRSWEDQQGKKHYTTEIIASSVEFIGQKKESNEINEPSFDSDSSIPF